MQGARKLIAIAHRQSTVKNSDKLIYLRDGRLAGIGTYEELLRNPRFRELT
jgi:ABC-type multidrug transport system fused ATPase/permease subunit